MTTGIKLRALREKKKLSQEELACIIGVSQVTIGNWEQGKSIKHEYVSKLAKALDVPVDYLLEEKQAKIVNTWIIRTILLMVLKLLLRPQIQLLMVFLQE